MQDNISCTKTVDGATCRMQITPEMTNRTGRVHGGYLAFLADEAMGQATEGPVANTDLRLHFLRPAMPGELRAEAIVRKKGRVWFIGVEIWQEKLIATGEASFVSL